MGALRMRSRIATAGAEASRPRLYLAAIKQFPCRNQAHKKGHTARAEPSTNPASAYLWRRSRAVTVALPCNSYRDAESRQRCNCRRFRPVDSAWILPSPQVLELISAYSPCRFTQPRSSRWHKRKVHARPPAHRPARLARNGRVARGTPARRIAGPNSNAQGRRQHRRARRGAAVHLPRRTSRLRVAPRTNTIRTAGKSSRAASNRAADEPTRLSTRKRTLVRSAPVAPEMHLSVTRTKARKVRRGKRRRDRVMNSPFEYDLHAPPRPPPIPHPGTDPHEHPTDPPVEVPVEPRPPHPGSDPVEVPTEPRPKHPSRQLRDAAVGVRAVRHGR